MDEKTKKDIALEIAAILSFSALSNNDKIGAIDKRVVVIETENRINSKQEGTIITMLNRIFNSIENK